MASKGLQVVLVQIPPNQYSSSHWRPHTPTHTHSTHLCTLLNTFQFSRPVINHLASSIQSATTHSYLQLQVRMPGSYCKAIWSLQGIEYRGKTYEMQGFLHGLHQFYLVHAQIYFLSLKAFDHLGVDFLSTSLKCKYPVDVISYDNNSFWYPRC